MAQKTQATATENQRSLFAVDLRAGQHGWVGDEPAAMGGADLGPAPYEVLTAALAECTAMTVRWYAHKQKWPLDRVHVVVTHETTEDSATGSKTDLFAKTIEIEGPSLSMEQRQKLREVAAKCPVQRTLERPSRVVTGP